LSFEAAFSKLIDKLDGWLEQAVLLLPNFLVGVVVVVFFWLLAKLVKKATDRLLEPILPTQIARLLASVGYLAMLTAGVFVALGVLGLNKTVTSLLAGAGILGLAIGFAFQDIAANFMSGILLALRRPFVLGELIEANGFFGTVQKISLRSTEIRSPQGQLVLVPNRQVFENPIVNYSRSGERRVDLAVGVAYGDDLEKARRVAVAAVEEIETRQADRPVELFYEEFGDSSINFVVRFWIDFARQREYLAARSEAIERLKAAFDEAGITIPFPIRTLDFGVVGGDRLSRDLSRLPALAGPSPGDA
jgi:small conductance mechanosensitive channel